MSFLSHREKQCFEIAGNVSMVFLVWNNFSGTDTAGNSRTKKHCFRHDKKCFQVNSFLFLVPLTCQEKFSVWKFYITHRNNNKDTAATVVPHLLRNLYWSRICFRLLCQDNCVSDNQIWSMPQEGWGMSQVWQVKNVKIQVHPNIKYRLTVSAKCSVDVARGHSR